MDVADGLCVVVPTSSSKYQFITAIHALGHRVFCMTDQTTTWDPSLLRKFSSTGHFRLLNQLRSDLKKKPLNRDAQTGQLQRAGTVPRQNNSRRPLVQQRRLVVEPSPQIEPLEQPQPETPRTFRERLNAIEMR